MKEERISSYQCIMMLTGFLIGTSVSINSAAADGENAWYTGLIRLTMGVAIASVTAALAMLYPGMSLVEILVACFGVRAGKVIGFGYLLLTVWLSGVVILNFSYYSNTTSYPETPLLFISICYMLVIAYIVRMGLEVLGRISEIFIVLIIMIILVTFASFATDFHPDAFLALFKNGIVSVTMKSMLSSSFPYSEIFLALNILPNLADKKKTYRTVALSVLVGGGILYLFTVRNISALGVNMAARNVYPAAKVFRLMPLFDVIPLLDVNVILSGVIKVSVSLYAQVRILGDLFGLKDFKIFVLPGAALDIAVSTILHRDLFTILFFAANIVPLLYLPVFVALPLVMLFTALVKKKKANPSAAPENRQT